MFYSLLHLEIPRINFLKFALPLAHRRYQIPPAYWVPVTDPEVLCNADGDSRDASRVLMRLRMKIVLGSVSPLLHTLNVPSEASMKGDRDLEICSQ
jgi:hypothetical protein